MNKRLVITCGAVALLAVVLSTVAEAQPPGRGGRGGPGFGGFGGGVDLMGLLRIEAVQKEIEALDDQIADIRQMGEQLRGERPEGRGGPGGQGPGGQGRDFQNLSDEERRQLFEEFQKRRQEREQQVEAKLAEILLPHQLDRLKQIRLQVQGTGALLSQETGQQLKIGDEQREKIEQVMRERGESMREQMRELFQAGDRDAIRAKMEEFRKETETQTLAVLTETQRTQFAQMKGEPFEMPEGAFGFGGRGGDGGRGRGGPGGGGERPARPDRPDRPEA